MSYLLGLDVGGTQIKAVAFTPDGEEIYRACHDTQDAGDQWKDNVKTVVQTFIKYQQATPEFIGLAAPGLAARDERSIAYMPGRLHSLEGLDWTDFLQSDSPVRVLNDTHAALLGEVWRGAAKGLKDVILLTLGTGVGGAILSEGRLLRGHTGRAGHLGHVSLAPGGAPDIVNTPGSLEDAIGNCTIASRSGGRFHTSKELLAEVAHGDAHALFVWNASVKALAAAIASYINVLDPELVILGGGLVNAGDALFNPLAQHLDTMEWRPGGHRVPIVPAQLGEYAGACGAAWYAGNTKNI